MEEKINAYCMNVVEKVKDQLLKALGEQKCTINEIKNGTVIYDEPNPKIKYFVKEKVFYEVECMINHQKHMLLDIVETEDGTLRLINVTTVENSLYRGNNNIENRVCA